MNVVLRLPTLKVRQPLTNEFLRYMNLFLCQGNRLDLQLQIGKAFTIKRISFYHVICSRVWSQVNDIVQSIYSNGNCNKVLLGEIRHSR